MTLAPVNPAPFAVPYFGSPAAYFRPDHRHFEPTRNSGQGRPARQQSGWLAAFTRLLGGCEHGCPLRRLGACSLPSAASARMVGLYQEKSLSDEFKVRPALFP